MNVATVTDQKSATTPRKILTSSGDPEVGSQRTTTFHHLPLDDDWTNARDRLDALVKRISYKPGWSLTVEQPGDRLVGLGGVLPYVRLIVRCRLPNSRSMVRAERPMMTWSPTLEPTSLYVDIERYATQLEDFRFFLAIDALQLDPDVDDHVVVRLIRNHLVIIERHELNEWFRLDGELVEDPHATGRNRL